MISGRQLLRWIPAIAWMVMIFSFSHQEGNTSGSLSAKVVAALEGWGMDLTRLFGQQAEWVVRKTAHFSEYLILFLLLRIPLKDKSLFYPVILAVLYAASDEFHQTFIPGRFGNLWDVMIDALGPVSGGIFSYVQEKKRRSAGKSSPPMT